jgi:hypothetical protein
MVITYRPAALPGIVAAVEKFLTSHLLKIDIMIEVFNIYFQKFIIF